MIEVGKIPDVSEGAGYENVAAKLCAIFSHIDAALVRKWPGGSVLNYFSRRAIVIAAAIARIE